MLLLNYPHFDSLWTQRNTYHVCKYFHFSLFFFLAFLSFYALLVLVKHFMILSSFLSFSLSLSLFLSFFLSFFLPFSLSLSLSFVLEFLYLFFCCLILFFFFAVLGINSGDSLENDFWRNFHILSLFFLNSV